MQLLSSRFARNFVFKKWTSRIYLRFFCVNERVKPVFNRYLDFLDNVAVVDNYGTLKYRDLICFSSILSKRIEKLTENQTSSNRISFLCTNDATYVSVLLACWLSGNIAVPLSTTQPSALLEYYIKDSKSSLVIANDLTSHEMQDTAAKLNLPFLVIEHPLRMKQDLDTNSLLNKISGNLTSDENFKDKGAIIIYTSGTTGLPKGVVLTHGNFDAQIAAILEAWELSSKDAILHTLPLHHIHGILYALLCPLSAGATVVMRPKFDAKEVWEYLLNTHRNLPKVNLFFAVPTMYIKLIKEIDKWSKPEDYFKIREKCKEIRLMASGSASLPASVFHQWENITAHPILERYGMSEIGMALSNSLNGRRVPGSVGNPLPGVKVRIVEMSDSINYNVLAHGDCSQVIVTPGCEGKSGELLISGSNVFKEYWNKEKSTKDSFTKDGWFITGDTAVYENGVFKILGRTSVDIIKSGGYKISALNVESNLLKYPGIIDCAVFGLPDEEWGEKVAAVLVTESQDLLLTELRMWCKKYMPSYAIPTVYKQVDVIPRNVMGKINKKELKSTLFTEYK